MAMEPTPVRANAAAASRSDERQSQLTHQPKTKQGGSIELS
jgi:hypothetical protein